MKMTVGKTDKKAGLRGVELGTYETKSKSKKAYTGWVSPVGRNAQWIIFTRANGDGVLYTRREPDGAVIYPAQTLHADKPKGARKEFHIDLTLYAHGKRRKATSNEGFSDSDGEGIRTVDLDSEEYKNFHKAAVALCQRLIDEGEL